MPPEKLGKCTIETLSKIATPLPAPLENVGHSFFWKSSARNKKVKGRLVVQLLNLAQRVRDKRAMKFRRSVRAQRWNQSGLCFPRNWRTSEDGNGGNRPQSRRKASRSRCCAPRRRHGISPLWLPENADTTPRIRQSTGALLIAEKYLCGRFNGHFGIQIEQTHLSQVQPASGRTAPLPGATLVLPSTS